jgi:predicted transposase YdaD
VSSSHDLFVKGILTNPNEAIDFFDGSLPESITKLLKLENLELTKETFIGNDHKESRTDLLYKIPLKSGSFAYIYLLFEHKSYYDPKIFTQLFELKRKGRAFQTRNLALRLYMRMIQIIRDIPEEFKIHLKEIYISLREEKEFAKRIEILRNLLEYLNRARIDAENYSVKEIVQGIEVEYMNVLDKIREEGELKGKLENKLETARKMKEFGDTLEKIKIITGLSEDELKENGIF